MLRFALLGSGSSGNAIWIATPSSKILIDNGLSYKQLDLRLRALGESLDGLKAIFITHEHSDHVMGLGILSRKHDVPIYMTRETHECLPPSIGPLRRVEYFEAGDPVAINGLQVDSFSISHDAADPVSYAVRHDGIKLGLACDLGYPSDLVLRQLSGSHALVIESNYCPTMLHTGSYPRMVQQRIRGKQGHLSNADMCHMLAKLQHEALKLVVLVHISEENNRYELAHAMARDALRKNPVEVVVARHNEPTRLFEIA
ncbi:MAG: MBL fold hydrolase [Candidatus Hydrogenedentota bacterium]